MRLPTPLAMGSAALLAGLPAQPAASDWRGFRGTDASASSETDAPHTWSDQQNLRWRLRLPGPGGSSPIVVGKHLFITCWSGYGLDTKQPGDPKALRRHLLKVARHNGEVVWHKTLKPAAREDPYGGRMLHGYASSTPVCDGERLYVFFGKRGALAFDLDGKLLWQRSVGTGSSQWLTGSGSSPTLWRDLLIINAADESQSLVALDRLTGKPRWQRRSKAFDQAYGTPVVAHGKGYPPTLVYGMLGAVWGLNPETGKPRWTVQTKTNGALAPTITIAGDRLYSFGGQTRVRSHAIDLGGSGDVSATHLKWKSRYGSYVTTPLVHAGRLHWVNEGGIAYCANAATGELIYKQRLDGSFYSSVVRAGERLYFVSRGNGTFVVHAGAKFELLHHNRIESDDSDFDATPALSDGQLFLRSAHSLYCIEARQ